MSPLLSAEVLRALPPGARLADHLAHLDRGAWQEFAEDLNLHLPECSLLIGLPGSAALLREVGVLRGVPGVLAKLDEASGHWTLPPLREMEVPQGERAAILSAELVSGEPELEVLLVAARRGLEVPVVAAAVEHTNTGGRARIELQGVRVHAAVQVADTPGGLRLERRIPHA
ncbi:hypothetical protein [Deinococcus navajonensis]|uniref:Uncharacterized protein n=1 Tax=Deinococcus navajonensis TaxID=309884 RepID=A0ABV8XJK8_9DEIO